MAENEFSTKTDYFSSLALSKLSWMKLLRDGELLRSLDKNVDVWRNVSEHVLVQTAACVALGEMLELSNKSLKVLTDAAIIHDGDKKYQSTGLNAINSKVKRGELSEEEAGKEKYIFFDESEKHAANWMKRGGVPVNVIEIATSDGHPALPRIMSPSSSFEQRIFHYIGSIVDQDDIVYLHQRIDALEQNPKYKMMNEYGRRVPWTKGRNLYEVQRSVGRKIEKEIVDTLLAGSRLDEPTKLRLKNSPTELPMVVKEWIERKYAK